VSEVRLMTKVSFERSDARREHRGGEAIAEILIGTDSITPEGRGKFRVGK
jgi:hypothetical protein